MSPILIISSGRSGSTTLLRILNTFKGYNIKGENKDFVSNMIRAYDSILYTNRKHRYKTYREYDRRRIKPCWYNSYNFEESKNNIKKTIKQFLNREGAPVWGCKEIRFAENRSYAEFKSNLKLFINLFPQTKIIFNIRENINNQAKSAWFKDNPDSINILKEHKTYYDKFMEENPKRCIMVSLEDMINNTKNFQNMYKFLGQKFNKDAYSKIMKEKRE